MIHPVQVAGNNSLWCESEVGKADFEAFQALTPSFHVPFSRLCP
jgi:hypothetical protein